MKNMLLEPTVFMLELQCPMREPLATCGYLKLNKVQNYLHQSHFKYSRVTCDYWLLLSSTGREYCRAAQAGNTVIITASSTGQHSLRIFNFLPKILSLSQNIPQSECSSLIFSPWRLILMKCRVEERDRWELPSTCPPQGSHTLQWGSPSCPSPGVAVSQSALCLLLVIQRWSDMYFALSSWQSQCSYQLKKILVWKMLHFKN